MPVLKLDSKDLGEFKKMLFPQCAFARRMSLQLLLRLLDLHDTEDYPSIWSEIEDLEAGAPTTTKRAEQFAHKPLHPLWHKHFFTSRNLIDNIGSHWGFPAGQTSTDDANDRTLKGEGNRKFLEFARNAVKNGYDPYRTAHEFVFTSINSRIGRRRITGDWIVFGRYNSQNYYIDLAEHEEGHPGPPAQLLFARLRDACVEFPFLFETDHS